MPNAKKKNLLLLGESRLFRDRAERSSSGNSHCATLNAGNGGCTSMMAYGDAPLSYTYDEAADPVIQELKHSMDVLRIEDFGR